MSDRYEDWERQQAENRELLTLAAKAAGLPLEWRDVLSADLRYRSMQPYLRMPSLHGHDKRMTDLKAWNPLNDDGDALRLAVQLRLRIEPLGSVFDSNAASRRAIVRAAAAIGSEPPQTASGS